MASELPKLLLCSAFLIVWLWLRCWAFRHGSPKKASRGKDRVGNSASWKRDCNNSRKRPKSPHYWFLPITKEIFLRGKQSFRLTKTYTVFYTRLSMSFCSVICTSGIAIAHKNFEKHSQCSAREQHHVSFSPTHCLPMQTQHQQASSQTVSNSHENTFTARATRLAITTFVVIAIVHFLRNPHNPQIFFFHSLSYILPYIPNSHHTNLVVIWRHTNTLIVASATNTFVHQSWHLCKKSPARTAITKHIAISKWLPLQQVWFWLLDRECKCSHWDCHHAPHKKGAALRVNGSGCMLTWMVE